MDMTMRKCPGCHAEAVEVIPEKSVSGEDIGVTFRYKCGSWDAESSSGFKTSYRSRECERETLSRKLVEKTNELSVAQSEWARARLDSNAKLNKSAGLLRSAEHKLSEIEKRHDERLDEIRVAYEEQLADLRAKLAIANDDVIKLRKWRRTHIAAPKTTPRKSITSRPSRRRSGGSG